MEEQMQAIQSLSLHEKAKLLHSVFDSCSSAERTVLGIKMSRSTTMDFLSALPQPASACVLSYLDPVSLLRCTRVCSEWYSLLTTSHDLWLSIVQRYLVTPGIVGEPQPWRDCETPYRLLLLVAEWLKAVKGACKLTVPTDFPPLCNQTMVCANVDNFLAFYHSSYGAEHHERLIACRWRSGKPFTMLWNIMVTSTHTMRWNELYLVGPYMERAGIVWTSRQDGNILHLTRSPLVCPWSPDYTSYLCTHCGFTIVFRKPHEEETISVLAAAPDESVGVPSAYHGDGGANIPGMSGARFCHYQLQLGPGDRVAWCSVMPDDDSEPYVEGNVCKEHRIIAQTRTNNFYVFRGVSMAKQEPELLVSSDHNPAVPTTVLKGPHQKHSISEDGKLVGCASGSDLYILDTTTLALLHKVDISACLISSSTPTIICSAIGSEAAILFAHYGNNWRRPPRVSSVFVVSLSGHVLCRVASSPSHTSVLDQHYLSNLTNLHTPPTPPSPAWKDLMYPPSRCTSSHPLVVRLV